MIITRVAIRRKKLYALYFNEPIFKFDGANFGENGELLIDQKAFDESVWQVGSNLDNEDIEQLCALSNYMRAKERGIYLLGIKDYTKRGMFNKLKGEFGEEAAEAVANRLAELYLIDDERFAERYAEQLIEQKHVSAQQAIYLLTTKGVSRDIAQEAVDNISPDPKRQITELIKKKYSNKLINGDEKSINSVMNALARKGFSFSDIRSVIREYSDSCEIFD